MQQEQQHKQQQHIKKLLNTAGIARGIVDDLDASLTRQSSRASIADTISLQNYSASGAMPLTMSMADQPSMAHSTKSQGSSKKRPPERNLWRLEEVNTMLEIMQEINAVELLNDKTIKSERVFRNVEQQMFERGFQKKSHGQIWTKWKFLKSTYMTSKRNGVIPKIIAGEIYGTLCKMLSNVALNNSQRGNSEYENSQTSMDDENSGSPGSNQEELGEAEEVTDMMGMPEHPVFGFNLALVKTEPSDAGYDTLNSNGLSTVDSPQVVDKNLNNDDSLLMPMPTTNNVKPEPFEYQAAYHRETCVGASSKSGRSRPASQLPVPKSTKSITITPVIESVHEDRRPRMEASGARGSNSNLRLAQFAKEQPILANVLQSPRRPLSPPPLALSSAGMKRRMENTDSAVNAKKAKSRTSMPAGLEFSGFDDVIVPHPVVEPSLRMDANNILANRHSSGPRLTNAALPDFYPGQSQFGSRSYQELAAAAAHSAFARDSSAMALGYDAALLGINAKTPAMKSKKRLASFDRNIDGSRPSDKKSKTYSAKQQPQLDPLMGGQMSAEDFRPPRRATKMDAQYSNAHNDIYDSRSTPPHSSSRRKPNSTIGDMSHDADERPSREQRELFDGFLKDLATSIRNSQREVLADFFQKQMELIRRDHEFLMRQDALVMRAFQEQREDFLKTAQELLGEMKTVKHLGPKSVKPKKCEKAADKKTPVGHSRDSSKSKAATNNGDEPDSETSTSSSSESDEQEDEEDEEDEDNENENENENDDQPNEMPTSSRLAGISQRDLRNLRLKTHIPDYATNPSAVPEVIVDDDNNGSDSDSNEIYDTTNSNN